MLPLNSEKEEAGNLGFSLRTLRARSHAGVRGHGEELHKAEDCVILSGNKYFSFRIPKAISRFSPETFFKLYPLQTSARAWKVLFWPFRSFRF